MSKCCVSDIHLIGPNTTAVSYRGGVGYERQICYQNASPDSAPDPWALISHNLQVARQLEMQLDVKRKSPLAVKQPPRRANPSEQLTSDKVIVAA